MNLLRHFVVYRPTPGLKLSDARERLGSLEQRARRFAFEPFLNSFGSGPQSDHDARFLKTTIIFVVEDSTAAGGDNQTPLRRQFGHEQILLVPITSLAVASEDTRDGFAQPFAYDGVHIDEAPLEPRRQ